MRYLTLDGWRNVVTGLGLLRRDKTTGLEVNDAILYTYRDLAEIYNAGGLGATIVDVVADDANNAEITFIGDDAQQSLWKTCESLNAWRTITEAHRWLRCFGGSAILALYENDRAPLEKPPSASAKPVGFRVYPASAFAIGTSKLFNDKARLDYGRAETLKLREEDIEIHHTRLYEMRGSAMAVSGGKVNPHNRDLRYWGIGALQKTMNELAIFGSFAQGIGHLGQEMVIGKYRIANLEKLLMTNDVEKIRARRAIIDESKSILKAVLLGKEEEYSRDALSFVGISDVYDRLAMLVSGASKIPITRLLGRAPAGLNATGESDSQNYDRLLISDQKNVCIPAARWIGTIVSKKLMQDSEIKMSDPRPLGREAEVKLREVIAKTDKLVLEMWPDMAERLKEIRYAGGYSYETSLPKTQERV